MKLNKDFLIHNSGGEAILVPTGKAGFSGVVRGNKTFGAILEILQSNAGGITEEEVIDIMRDRFNAPEGAIEGDVMKALSELRRIGAIED